MTGEHLAQLTEELLIAKGVSSKLQRMQLLNRRNELLVMDEEASHVQNDSILDADLMLSRVTCDWNVNHLSGSAISVFCWYNFLCCSVSPVQCINKILFGEVSKNTFCSTLDADQRPSGVNYIASDIHRD
jgi:hypothetical protein